MRALVWIVEDTWEATVAEAAALLPADAEITLLHVTHGEAEGVAHGARHGSLGRVPNPRSAHEPLRSISERAARELLAEAEVQLGRPAARRLCRGRVEREVVTAAADVDLLVLARDGDHRRLGPRSLGPAARFVVDHAACRVLLVWPDEAPALTTVPPHPPPGGPRHPPRRPGRA
jgi:nucleotide-binding universal stress UspA family protein